MNKEDKEALNELLRGVAFAVGVVGTFIILIILIGTPFGFWREPQEPPQNGVKSLNFEVVDTYKGCDVVQWHRSSLAEYKYFLHCNNTRPVYEK